MGPMERLALSWGNARQFTKLLLSLLSHIGKMACRAEARARGRLCLAYARLRRGSLALAALRAKAGGLPRIRTEFSPVKSRDFTVKVCNPITTRRRS